MKQNQIQAALPLTPKVYHILLALAEEPQNGYQLGLKVEESSGGKIRLSPGTLYENLHKLANRGIIDEAGRKLSHKTDGRGQRFYQLTDFGLEVLKAEVARLSHDVALAKALPAFRSQ